MKLIQCWHYIFMDFPYVALKEKGFETDIPINPCMQFGFLPRSVWLQDFKEIQYREILDEEDFIKSQAAQNNRRNSIHDLLKPGVIFEKDGSADQIELNGLFVNVIAKSTDVDNNIKKSKKSDFKILSLYWNLNLNDISYFKDRFQLKLENNRIRMTDGIEIQLAQPTDSHFKIFEARKDFSFWAIVIETYNDFIKRQLKEHSYVQEIMWENEVAYLIKNHITQMDLIILPRSLP